MKKSKLLGIIALALSVIIMPKENMNEVKTQVMETATSIPEPVFTAFEIGNHNDIPENEVETEIVSETESEPETLINVAEDITETETESEKETEIVEITEVETETEVDLSDEELTKDELKKIKKLLSKKSNKTLRSSYSTRISDGVKYTVEISSNDNSSAYVCRMEIMDEEEIFNPDSETFLEIENTSEEVTEPELEGEKETLLIEPVSETSELEQEEISE